ncbi:MAG: alpha/beta hydrolase [Caulobacterales bacterium]|nr:alpha/beta hydrolase [Caulobacterales bacterium]
MLKYLVVALAAATAFASSAAAQPADPNRLFGDSKLVVRGRFSDEIVGKGPDVVFIPGLSSSRAVWKASAQRLRAHHRVHLLQLAGFAGEPPRANATGEVLVPTADAIDAYLTEQKLAPAVLVGHSLGGTLILQLAITHPEHLKKALVVDAVPFLGSVRGDPNATVESVRPTAEKIRDRMAGGGDGFASGLKGSTAAMVTGEADKAQVIAAGLQSDPGVVSRYFYEDLLLDLRPKLAQIRTPITLLYPDNVAIGAPPGAMQKVYPTLYAAVPTVRPQLVEHSLHFVMLDQPKAFADALDAFLAP